MKLYYYKRDDGIQNFGDDLNVWLWHQFLPNFFDENEDISFVGIGTLLNDELPFKTSRSQRRIIFSTGAGYGKGKLKIDDSYKIYCVRGPLSAKVLGIDPGLAVTDGAVLIRRLVKSTNTRKKYKFSYMPHFTSACKTWESICKEIGFGYIDPKLSTEEILSQLGQAEILITEAMHGAIVADALRIPWIPTVTNPGISSFKWKDWCQSLNLNYQPEQITCILHSLKQDKWSAIRNQRNFVTNLLNRKKVAQQLISISKQTKPFLSSEVQIEQKTCQLEEKLEQLKSYVASKIT